ncbi:hypothetical protein J2W22_002258 [Sphingomonas kyeonggiensis]|uniref:tetratricopeptide repeat protein n=1 Tax=Sphingomonas kyeonggiensis TaxID=1268553 RepID=UPI00278A835D|nr:hypothetical protein [Sphingomonas kyeonggiensis]MDQ0250194.1 hypothetical protein [Sphingomonas kyeonggiensis]
MANKRKFGRVAPGTLVKAGLLGVVGIGIGGLILKVEAGEALADRRDQPPAFAQSDDTVFRRAAVELVTGARRLTPTRIAQIKGAASRHPLAAEPFSLLGADAMARGDTRRGEALLIEARRRNPRDRLARLSLLEFYLKTNQIKAATTELTVLTRLVSRAGDLVVPLLAQLAENGSSRAAVAAALRGDPLLDAVLDRLTETHAAPAVVLDLAKGRKPAAPGGYPPAWQAAVVNDMIAAGDGLQARALWAKFNNVPASAEGAVFNPKFQRLGATPPFNWDLTSNSLGAAEIKRRGGLMVEYYGRDSGDLAKQTLLLTPGAYELRITLEGNADGQGSRLVWKLGCVGGKTALLEIPMKGIKYSPKTLLAAFNVPSGCGAQVLSLEGVAQEFPTNQSLEVSEVRIDKAGTKK